VQIHINGEVHDIERPLSITELLERLGHASRRVAVEVNREIVPRSQHERHQVREGDRIELVTAMGGGCIRPRSGDAGTMPAPPFPAVP